MAVYTREETLAILGLYTPTALGYVRVRRPEERGRTSEGYVKIEPGTNTEPAVLGDGGGFTAYYTSLWDLVDAGRWRAYD